MSDTPPEFDPEDYEGVQPKVESVPRHVIRRLEKDKREATKRAEEAAAELATLRREAAFLRAGIPVDDPGAKYFVKGYDGELEPEAIRSAAVEARILQADPQQQQRIDQSLAGNEAAMQLGSGAQSAPPVDLAAEMATVKQKVRDRQMSQEEFRRWQIEKFGPKIPDEWGITTGRRG